MSKSYTVDEIMERMPGAFNAQKAGEASAIVQYRFAGDQSGDWVVRIGEGQCNVERGVTDTADLTLHASGSDYVDVVTGKLNPMSALMSGKLKLDGDLGLAMKLIGYFDI